MKFEDHNEGVSFEITQRKYFAGILGQRWDCDEPGHTVCVLTEDGQHHQLSDQHVAQWVDALCRGEATTSQPPDGILPRELTGSSSTSTLRAVSIPPSHRRSAKSPILCATSSIRDGMSSRPSTAALGPGYLSGKAIKWLGDKCLNGFENVVIFKRCWQHEYRLKRWEVSNSTDGVMSKEQFFEMLGDMLELSKDCYSHRVRRRAFELAGKADLLTLDAESTLGKEEAAKWRVMLAWYYIPLRISYFHDEPCDSELDFLYDLQDALAKVPLELQDTRAASDCVNILGSQLLYSTATTRVLSSQGFELCRVLWATLQLRELIADEAQMIYRLATRRLERYDGMCSTSCRPWEVAIIWMCSSQHPMLEDLIRGPSGISSLVLALRTMLKVDIQNSPEDFTHDIEQVLRALYWLSSSRWAPGTASGEMVTLMVDVLRRQIVTLPSAYKALIVLDDIISRQPTLIEDFVHANGGSVLPNIDSFMQDQLKSITGWAWGEFMAKHSLVLLTRLRRATEQQPSINLQM